MFEKLNKPLLYLQFFAPYLVFVTDSNRSHKDLRRGHVDLKLRESMQLVWEFQMVLV